MKVKCIHNNASVLKHRELSYNAPLTIGKIYDVIGDNVSDWIIHNDNGVVCSYDKSRFKIMEELSLEEQILKAISFVGKRVAYKSNTFKVTGFRVNHKNHNTDESFSVIEYLKNHDFCVTLITKDGLAYPLNTCELSPIFKEVKLNDNYTAKVYVDKIEVGCQTFSIEILDKLIESKNSL